MKICNQSFYFKENQKDKSTCVKVRSHRKVKKVLMALIEYRVEVIGTCFYLSTENEGFALTNRHCPFKKVLYKDTPGQGKKVIRQKRSHCFG